MLNKYKQRYQSLQKQLISEYKNQKKSVITLMQNRSKTVDLLLQDIWQEFDLSNDLCLLAVGGYGRCELCLYSDIDLLILLPDEQHKKYQNDIVKFLSFLWDVGLEVGHATRDMNDCVVALEDLSVVTNMLEARYLLGDDVLLTQMQKTIKKSHWQSQSFLVAKQKELRSRHQRFAGTAYGVEPNIKDSPGGLRDIQTLLWVTKWHWGLANLDALLHNGFLTKNEHKVLRKQQNLLHHLRFGLHIVAKRREDKIGFNLQRTLADKLGFIDGDKMAVEQMMHKYYKSVSDISRICDILMQVLQKRILHTQQLNEDFSVRAGYLRIVHQDLFSRRHSALLEVFLLCAQHNYIKGIDVLVLRAIEDNLGLIDAKFRLDATNANIFMDILRAKQGINAALRLMSRCGVLARYIPAFGKISGLMQYDLFHKFTVDQHTLFVMRNLRRFFIPEHAKEFDLCHKLAVKLDKPELLILAGLFHDIGKGRGGHHAQLGAIEAKEFCQLMNLNKYDTGLVVWLVKTHLLMSTVAQKQDISDPEVVLAFSREIGIEERLKYLYLLTVADIRGTSKELWNDWKDALLKQLYHASYSQLRKGLDNSKAQAEIMGQTQQIIEHQLTQYGVNSNLIKQWHQTLPNEYFMRYQADEIIWHYQLIQSATKDNPTVIGFSNAQQGRVNIFIYTQDKPCIFLNMISALESLLLSVLEAKVISSCANKTFNTISIAEYDIYELDIKTIKEKILSQLKTIEQDNKLIHLSDKSLQHKHFSSDTHISIRAHHNAKYSILEVKTMDRKGILSSIVSVLCGLHLVLINARVITFGERIEDIFFIANAHNNVLNEEEAQTLIQKLEDLL